MPRDGAITDVCRSLSNRTRVNNLALSRLQPSAGARVSKGRLSPHVFEKICRHLTRSTARWGRISEPANTRWSRQRGRRDFALQLSAGR